MLQNLEGARLGCEMEIGCDSHLGGFSGREGEQEPCRKLRNASELRCSSHEELC